jgi:transposase
MEGIRMVKINFTEEDVVNLRNEMVSHPHPRVQVRMFALLLKAQGLHHKKICEVLGICHDTLTDYCRAYQKDGIEGLKKLTFYRPQSKMEEYRDTIEEELKKNPPATIKEAAAMIEKLTGIKRSDTQVRKFLKKTVSKG